MKQRIIKGIVVQETGRTCQTSYGVYKLATLKKEDGTVISWSEKQSIKNIVYGDGAFAVEVFPPESQLIDVVNLYHLWVLEGSTDECPIGWNEGRQVLTDGRQHKTFTEEKVDEVPERDEVDIQWETILNNMLSVPEKKLALMGNIINLFGWDVTDIKASGNDPVGIIVSYTMEGRSYDHEFDDLETCLMLATNKNKRR